jgi:hypothetical protein
MPQQSSSTHYPFLRIIAAVSQSRASMTTVDLGRVLDTPPDVIAQCIALHLYLERKRIEEIPIPLPVDYWVPQATEVISRTLLEPKRAGQMPGVDATLTAVLGNRPMHQSRQRAS